MFVPSGVARATVPPLGRGPKDIHTKLSGDLLSVPVRLDGILTEAEQLLVKPLPAVRRSDLLNQARTQSVETAGPGLEAMIQEVSDVKVLSMHHDISTSTGEDVVLITHSELELFT